MTPQHAPEISGLDSSNGRRTEAAESRFMRLLTLLSTAGDAVTTGDTDSIEDVRAYAELVDGGFISASKVGRDGSCSVSYVAGMEITISGRRYLAELRHEAEAQTSAGIIKHGRWKFYWWFLAIVGAAFLAWRLSIWFGDH